MPSHDDARKARREKEKWERQQKAQEDRAMLEHFIRRKAVEAEIKREQDAKALKEYLANR